MELELLARMVRVNIDHLFLLIITLYPAFCFNGQLQLSSYIRDNFGTLLVCSQQRWATLSSLHWNDINAQVACYELGFGMNLTMCLHYRF